MNTILWTEDAAEDLFDIISYQRMKYGLEKANAVYESIQKRVSSLMNFPQKGRVAPELHSIGITSYRELVESPWRIIYRVADSTVYIVTLLDSRRNVEEVLYKKVIDGKI